MKDHVASRKQPDFFDMEPYYILSFMCMNPRNQLKYFYINRFPAIKKEEHFGYLTLDTSYNPYIINPIYQLYIMLQQNCIQIMKLLDKCNNMDWKEYSLIEGLYDSQIRDKDFIENFESHLDVHTSINDFLKGEMWHELRKRCALFLKRVSLPIWQKFEKPIQFSFFLYPVNFEVYTPLPYWSDYETYDEETWELLKRKYELLYKDAHINF